MAELSRRGNHGTDFCSLTHNHEVMTAETVSARLLAALAAALALGPVGAFLVGRGEPSVVLALVNVLLIAGSIYYLFGPAEIDHGHGAESSA